jgi:hypothetical protein
MVTFVLGKQNHKNIAFSEQIWYSTHMNPRNNTSRDNENFGVVRIIDTKLSRKWVSIEDLRLRAKNTKLPEWIREVMDMYIIQVERGIWTNNNLFPHMVADIIDWKPLYVPANEDMYNQHQAGPLSAANDEIYDEGEQRMAA